MEIAILKLDYFCIKGEHFLETIYQMHYCFTINERFISFNWKFTYFKFISLDEHKLFFLIKYFFKTVCKTQFFLFKLNLMSINTINKFFINKNWKLWIFIAKMFVNQNNLFNLIVFQ